MVRTWYDNDDNAFLEERLELVRQTIRDAFAGIPISMDRCNRASKMFDKEFCDSIGVHYFDYSPQELLKNPNRMCIVEVLKGFDMERELSR